MTSLVSTALSRESNCPRGPMGSEHGNSTEVTHECGGMPENDKVRFWDGYAKWYKLWTEHNTYHDPIIEFLKETVEPGWRILDIGAGNGALALPCAPWAATSLPWSLP